MMEEMEMSRIIASTYEIEHEIGSGGGGVVYLAKHLRLDKPVVLKADKRELKTGKDELRREVDILKNLSHTYIPQVYDFVAAEGIVYTVEDYIPGKSLDKYLKQGERFSQVQVIHWACQLLEALCYLHSRPPYGILHGDIKPANIMLRADGSICLVDYNIALFLGEEGAVKAGSSLGYASPEHYGIDFSSVAETHMKVDASRTEYGAAAGSDAGWTEYSADLEMDAAKTKYGTVSAETVYSAETAEKSSTLSQKAEILIDVRSDIYGLGATLYHLLTAHRPAQKATEVVPINQEDVSKAVADIIKKAMNPNPDLRYQSAEEMLYAFEHLHEQDSRAKRHRRRKYVCGAVFTAILLAGSGITYIGLKQMERMQNMYALAEYSGNALREGDAVQAVQLALDALPKNSGLFEIPALAQPQKALTDALGVYELTDEFKPHDLIELPAEIFNMRMSPDGTRVAVVYAYEMAVFDLESSRQLAVLPIERSALSEVEFIDNERIVFAGEGMLEAYDLAAGKVLWTGHAATGITVSENGKIAAAVYKDDTECYLYDTETGRLISVIDFHGRGQSVIFNDIFANPEDNLFELNKDGTYLAVSFSDGSLDIFHTINPDDSLILLDASDSVSFSGGFFNEYFAFSAESAEGSDFSIVDTKQLVQTGGFTLPSKVSVTCDATGIYICNDNLLVGIDPVSGEQESAAYTMAEILDYQRGDEFTIVSTVNNAYYVFTQDALQMQSFTCDFTPDFVGVSGQYLCAGSMNTTQLQVLKLQNHDSVQIAVYDASYVHAEARISSTYQTAMLYNFEGFCLFDYNGKVIKEDSFQNQEQIYDQQYRRDETESYLEITYYDGTVNCYSAKDGALMESYTIEEPDKSLYEEFFTDEYRIASKLNGAPEVFRKSSGERICELESDDYLTYVTQVNEYIMTEYTTADGERYGLLRNENFETIACLPNLCDILDGAEFDNKIVFVIDDGLGSLRQCDMYSLQELQTLGEIYINKREEQQ